jgi:hypothetical protein
VKLEHFEGSRIPSLLRGRCHWTRHRHYSVCSWIMPRGVVALEFFPSCIVPRRGCCGPSRGIARSCDLRRRSDDQVAFRRTVDGPGNLGGDEIALASSR